MAIARVALAVEFERMKVQTTLNSSEKVTRRSNVTTARHERQISLYMSPKASLGYLYVYAATQAVMSKPNVHYRLDNSLEVRLIQIHVNSYN